MACDLTGGRLRPCKDVVGGIKTVVFVDYGDLGTVTINTSGNDEITNIDSTFNYHVYDVKGNASLETNITSSIENGTTFFEQVVNMTFPKLTKEDNKEIKLMAFGRPHIFIETNHNEWYAVGIENGADVTGGTMVTGTAMGDLSGYTLTFTASERFVPNFMNNATADNPFAGMADATATPSTQRNPAE